MQPPATDKVYARPPPGYRLKGYWWLLLNNMNGMRKASQDFAEFFAAILTEHLDFRRCQLDVCLFVHNTKNVRVGTHIEDPIAVGEDLDIMFIFAELKHYV
eukprot:16235725-Heterocapsa_arctica.AAC.1